MMYLSLQVHFLPFNAVNVLLYSSMSFLFLEKFLYLVIFPIQPNIFINVGIDNAITGYAPSNATTSFNWPFFSFSSKCSSCFLAFGTACLPNDFNSEGISDGSGFDGSSMSSAGSAGSAGPKIGASFKLFFLILLL